jgi:hypothetical protein
MNIYRKTSIRFFYEHFIFNILTYIFSFIYMPIVKYNKLEIL